MALSANTSFNEWIPDILHNKMRYSPWNSNTGKLYIYKGTVPSSGDIANWSSYSSTRSTDLLATLEANAIATGDAARFEVGDPVPAPGSATGTATWASWVSSLSQAIIGTVSVSGGDGLFILDSTSINTSTNIVVVGFRMQW